MTKVAVVTGANKGIGFGITRGLCKRFEGDVYLTARDEARGRSAVSELQKEGFNPVFHQLDITDPTSITKLRDHLQNKYGGIDILVNNAAIAFKNDSTELFAIQAEETNFVNYFSLVSVCDILLPLMKPNSRVINLSSSCGHLFQIPGEAIRNKFADFNLTEAGLSALVKEFVQSAKNGTNKKDGWGNSAYVVSKVAVSALTFIQSRQLSPRGVAVNCVHPGYVDTDMTSHKGPLTIEQGSQAALHLALDAPQDLTGVYMWHDKTVVDWYKELTV